MNNFQDDSIKGESVKTDFTEDMTYSEYLGLDKVLSAQHTLTDSHDEKLFIIVHQVSELWMNLIIHEINSACDDVKNDQFKQAFKKLARVGNIQKQLIQVWEVLSTMTPSDYLTFRDDLGSSSGFQSYQNRMLEYSLGYKTTHALKIYEKDANIYNLLKRNMLLHLFFK